MSLDVYLYQKGVEHEAGSGIWIRENGQTIQISREEWDERYPGREPVITPPPPRDDPEVFHANITHNLNRMAKEAGLYETLWRPEEMFFTHANQLIAPLKAGLARLRRDPQYFKAFNPENGWGNYDNLVRFVTDYLMACKAYPDAEIHVSR